MRSPGSGSDTSPTRVFSLSPRATFPGTGLLSSVASGVFRMRERPYILGGLLIIAGYYEAMLRRLPRYDDRRFRKHLHHWQLKRLGLGWLVRKPG